MHSADGDRQCCMRTKGQLDLYIRVPFSLVVNSLLRAPQKFALKMRNIVRRSPEFCANFAWAKTR